MRVLLQTLKAVALAATLSAAAPTTDGQLQKRVSGPRTSAPSGCLSVKAGSTASGYYQTLTAALASLSGTASACIFLYSGTYTEQVTINYGGPLTIYGYTLE